MKKLALSLVLTLGVSGVALASNGKVEKKKQQPKENCHITTIHKTIGLCSGEELSMVSVVQVVSGEDCPGGGNGGDVTLFYRTKIKYADDCNWDSILYQNPRISPNP